LLALGGLALSAVCGGLYYLAMDDAARRHVTGALAGLYLGAAVLGLLLQAIAWMAQWLRLRLRPRLSAAWLGVASVGVLTTVIGATVVREAIRLSAIDIHALYERHARAATVGGMPIFLLFFAVNAALIAWCIALAQSRRGAS
jgi:hypothetical protein